MISLQEYYYLLSADAIHERAQQVLQLALNNQTHFEIRLEKLADIAQLTSKITQANYLHGHVPLHSRWRQFVVDHRDRSQFLYNLPLVDCAKARVDLAIISVLLDAGAGPNWTYRTRDGQIFARSEGLAVASLAMFAEGKFSSNKTNPWRVDAEVLMNFSLADLATGLQVSHQNPLHGLEQRVQLLQNLGKTILQNFDQFPDKRPAGICQYLLNSFGNTILGTDLLNMLLLNFNSIWPGRTIDGYALGDTWDHPDIGWIPFHKLTLWLLFSLIEPLKDIGIEITDLYQLPGLAEYRNGGLFIDGGVLILKNQNLFNTRHAISSPLIIEWRALTIALLDKLAPLVNEQLNMNLSLVNILQGGTWEAGRKLAFQRSPQGEPPLKCDQIGIFF